MKVNMTLLVSDPDINKIMGRLDLRQDGKYYVRLYEVSYDTFSEVNEKYFNSLLEMSWDESCGGSESFIAGIIHNDNCYYSKHVNYISDGKYELFIRFPNDINNTAI